MRSTRTSPSTTAWSCYADCERRNRLSGHPRARSTHRLVVLAHEVRGDLLFRPAAPIMPGLREPDHRSPAAPTGIVLTCLCFKPAPNVAPCGPALIRWAGTA